MKTRRDFLKCSALLGIAASFPVHFSFAQDTSAKSERDPLLRIPYGHIHAQHPKPRVITIPDVGKYKVLKGDFHIHTLFSDGQVMPSARVQEAVQNGFDCIAITDHIEYRPYLGGNLVKLADDRNGDYNLSYTLAKPEADRSNLILIRGAEITKMIMPPGHLNAIFLKDVNPIAAVVDDWKKMLEVAVDQGGFITWNHPGWVAPRSGGLAEGVPMSFTAEHEDVRKKGHLHAIEVFNGSEHYPIVSDWCNDLNLGILATSDIHPSEWQQYGVQNLRRPITLMLAEERSEESIREAFFARRTIGWVADMIFGRPEWVEKLFAACIEVVHGSGAVSVKNKGDILIRLLVKEKEYELKPQGEAVSISCADGDQCRVTNWFVGTYKPLEFSCEAFRNRFAQ